MSLPKGLKAWFGDEAIVEEFLSRTKKLEDKIEDENILTRATENEEETDDPEDMDTENVVGDFIVTDEEVLVLATRVSTVLGAELAPSMLSIMDRISALETLKEDQEDVPKRQKLRFKSDEVQQGEQPEPVLSRKQQVAARRKQNVENVQNPQSILQN